jgi:F-type H+-transporting ATPase subunit b
MPQFDSQYFQSQIIWLIICLCIVFLFLKNYFVPRLSKITSARRQILEEENEKINSLTNEILEIQKIRDEKILSARQEAVSIMQEIRRECESYQDEQLKAIDNELNGRLIEFKKQLDWHLKTYEDHLEEALPMLIETSVVQLKKREG